MEPSGVISIPRCSEEDIPLVLDRVRRLVAAGAIAVVAACQAPAATPTSPASGAPPTGPAATPAATAGTSTGLRGLFHVVGSAPVIPRTLFDDRGAVLPAAIAVDLDDGYLAWVIAFGEPAGTQELHYLTSTDALRWLQVDDGSLAGLSEGFANPGAMPTSVLETADGWVMYLSGALAADPHGWDIWRATAPAPGGPWTRGAEPVLKRGPAGAWDSAVLDFPSVWATDDGFSMLYSGLTLQQRDARSIGLATSPDGVTWTKHDDPATTDGRLTESDPVIEPGLCGGFDDRAVHQPRVVVGDNGLSLTYVGQAVGIDSPAGVGFADSLDGGLTWGCEWSADALEVTELPAGQVHTMNLFHRGARLSLLVEWLTDDGTDIWLAHLGPREP